MKKTLIFGLFSTAMLAMTSCSAVKSLPAEALSGEWDIVKVNGAPVSLIDKDAKPYLGFDVANCRFYGYGGCNYMMGTFATGEENEIKITTGGVTMMMCPDIAFQDSLMQTMDNVARYMITKDGKLTLSAANDATLISLVKRPDTISPSMLAGEWQVTALGECPIETGDDTPYTITFFPEDSTFSMTTDCNNVGGNFSGRFVDIRFDGLRSTRMACPDMTIERAAIELLPTVTSFSLLGDGNYAFYDEANNMVMMIAPLEK